MSDDDLSELLGMMMAMTMHKAMKNQYRSEEAGRAFIAKMESLGYQQRDGMDVVRKAAEIGKAMI